MGLNAYIKRANGYYKRNHGKIVYSILSDSYDIYFEYRSLKGAVTKLKKLYGGDNYQISNHGCGSRSIQIIKESSIIYDSGIKEENLKLCACCGNFVISDDDEIAAQDLCDRCHNEINAPDDIVGWRKGE